MGRVPAHLEDRNSRSMDTDAVFGVTVGPVEGRAVAVLRADVAHELLAQIGC